MHRRWNVSVLSGVLAALVLTGAAAAQEIPIDSETFGALQARSIGPAVMSGRIAALAAVPGDPLTIYVGAASGGVWKSRDGGVTWKPIFDDHTQSIGALAIDPQEPETVWVGTGESWTRNSVSVGTGLYRTTDGGETWNSMGLEDSERIARIAVHPGDGNTVYVCATGHLWDGNDERGVYKTTDGGKTWKRVLFVDQDTGCSDLALDPQEPQVLYAGLWQFRRSPDFFQSGGPGSGLYRSLDGGETWEELQRGLPEGEKGRIAVAVAPSRPSVVYALVEAKETALYRSDDLGHHWTKVNSSFNLQVRPFYFAHLVVDPSDHNRIYKPGLTLTVSTDGGKSFTSSFLGGFGGSVHSDHHALWIDPRNPHHLLLGTDGGLYVSYDRGTHWRFVRALPISQFYHVSYDLEWPYNVYGGLQDNGTWMGPSRSAGGIGNWDWKNIGYGDGFWAFADPTDSDILYVEYQGGKILRHRRSTGEIQDIQPYPGEGEPDYRFNWNTPIHLSPTRPGTIYVGAQFLFRSRDRGESWEKISPDLTTNDPRKQRQKESGGLTIDNSTAENHTTIYAVSESPLNGQVIWVGTDDGNLQVTRDGGESWTNVVGNVPGVPPGTWVSSVQASQHAEGTAYVTFDGHRTGDMATYVYRTRDFGATWTSLAGPGIEGYAWVVKEDPVNPNLLFLGTEFGLYLTLDGGATWARFTGNLSKVAVHDLAIHPTEGDLILATHGRGIYILDDLTPIRNLTAQALEEDLTPLPSRPAVMVLNTLPQAFNGDDEFVAPNPPEAAAIVYHLRRRHIFGDLKVEIYDHDGHLISTLPGGKRRGLNRVDWPMRLPPPKVPQATSLIPAFVGPRVPEGTYTVRLLKGDKVYESQVTLVPDPRSPHSAEDRRLQQETSLKLYRMLERLTYVVDAVTDLRDQSRARAQEIGEKDRLGRRLTDFAAELEESRASLVATSEAGWLSGEEKLREKMGSLYGAVSGYDGRPTDSQLRRLAVLEGELEAAEERFATLTSRGILALSRQLQARGLEPLKLMTPDEWRERQERGRPGGSSSSGWLPAGEVADLLRHLALLRRVI